MTGTLPSRFVAKVIILCTALFVAGSVAPLAHGQSELRSLPPILSTISDEVGVLTVSQGQKLAATLADIEQTTGVTIIVLIVASAYPETFEAYVQRLINRWRRESKRLDHGRFVFVAVAKKERELRIVPSEKLAWVLKPLTKGEAAVQATTFLKQEKYFEALTTIAEKLSQLIADQRGIVRQETKTPPRLDTIILATMKTMHP